MHSDLEAGAQHLLDLEKHVDIERANEKEGRASKLARLHNFAKDGLKRSMERHARKPRGLGGTGSTGGRTEQRPFL